MVDSADTISRTLKLWKPKRAPSMLAAYMLIIFGALALILSVVYESTILAFIGLGLTFWGALFLFVRPVRYAKAELIDSTAISSLATIDKIIGDLHLEGKGIHLPPRYLKEFKSGKIFIPAANDIVIPPAEEVAEDIVFLKNPQGICLIPSGVGLVNLFEKELGTDFTRVDLNYLQNNLPKLFIENLEIAEDFEMTAEKNDIYVKIIGTVYGSFCNEAKKFPSVCNSFGCPICSSIACALARATGKPVIIERNDSSSEKKRIEVHYRIIEE